MSQYRDDRDAARRRIEALEQKLAERDAELSARDAILAERHSENARLRRELELTGNPVRRGPVHAAWAVRMVGVAVGVAAMAMALGVWAIRAPRAVIVEAPPAEAVAQAEPILADPAPIAVRHVPTADEQAAPGDPSAAMEDAMRLKLEPKVWAGNATVDEIRMLKAICAHQGDRACHARASAMLPRAKPQVF